MYEYKNIFFKIMHKILQNTLSTRSTGNYSTLHCVPTKLKSQLLQNSGNRDKHKFSRNMSVSCTSSHATKKLTT